MRSLFWSKEEEKLFRDLWGKKSVEELAELFERSEKAMLRKAEDLELPTYGEVQAIERVKRIREKLNRSVEG